MMESKLIMINVGWFTTHKKMSIPGKVIKVIKTLLPEKLLRFTVNLEIKTSLEESKTIFVVRFGLPNSRA